MSHSLRSAEGQCRRFLLAREAHVETFALVPTLRVTFFTLLNLPRSYQRWRLQQYEHKQAAFARPKYACTAGYVGSFYRFFYKVAVMTCRGAGGMSLASCGNGNGKKAATNPRGA